MICSLRPLRSAEKKLLRDIYNFAYPYGPHEEDPDSWWLSVENFWVAVPLLKRNLLSMFENGTGEIRLLLAPKGLDWIRRNTK